jgi:hypothetical protein
MSAMTLTADAAHMPFGLIPMRDAVSALVEQIQKGTDRVQALVSDESRRFRNEDRSFDIPAPLVIVNYDHTEPWERVTAAEAGRPTSRVLFARDGWQCQYCGMAATPGSAHKQLTVDHVKPAHLFPNRRAATTWDNITTACHPCNRRKGGLLPRDARNADGRVMLPAKTPAVPHFVQVRFAGRLVAAQRDYVQDYFGLKGRDDVAF